MINDEGDENEEWERISSEDLVPGDIILIPTNGCEMSCDAIVLSGTAIGWYPNFIESEYEISYSYFQHFDQYILCSFFSKRVNANWGIRPDI